MVNVIILLYYKGQNNDIQLSLRALHNAKSN